MHHSVSVSITEEENTMGAAKRLIESEKKCLCMAVNSEKNNERSMWPPKERKF